MESKAEFIWKTLTFGEVWFAIHTNIYIHYVKVQPNKTFNMQVRDKLTSALGVSLMKVS